MRTPSLCLLPVLAGLAVLTSCTTFGGSRVHDMAFTASVSSPGRTDSTLILLDTNALVGKHVAMDVGTLRNITFVQPNSNTTEFLMTGGGLVAQDGDLFHVAGVPSTVRLTDVRLALSNEFLLRVEGRGRQGGQCDFTAEDQTLVGAVVVDAASALRLQLTRGSSFAGTINQGAPGGTVEVSIDATSEWTLTGDAHVTALTGPLDRVKPNGYRLWVGSDQVL
jgi:hypothetical protein